MRINVDVAMQYRFPRANTLLLALEAARSAGQTVLHEDLRVGDAELHSIAGDSGVGERIWARVPEGEMNLTYQALVEITRPPVALEALDAVPLHRIPGEVAPYLRPSRYCQSDKFGAFVDKKFGKLEGGRKVAAIRDWIEDKLTYVPGSSDADTNVLETFAGRQGVCRDYAHLMCSMARAAQIPTRMAAVYSPDVTPPDFHAVTEVWLSGEWHLVDATGMSSADSTAVIAVGRDAYDVAIDQRDARLTRRRARPRIDGFTAAAARAPVLLRRLRKGAKGGSGCRAQQTADLVLQLEPLAAQLGLVGVGDRLDGGFRAVNRTVDLVVFVGEAGEMAVGFLQRVQLVGKLGEFFGEFVRRMAHLVLIAWFGPTLLCPAGRRLDLDQSAVAS